MFWLSAWFLNVFNELKCIQKWSNLYWLLVQFLKIFLKIRSCILYSTRLQFVLKNTTLLKKHGAVGFEVLFILFYDFVTNDWRVEQAFAALQFTMRMLRSSSSELHQWAFSIKERYVFTHSALLGIFISSKAHKWKRAGHFLLLWWIFYLVWRLQRIVWQIVFIKCLRNTSNRFPLFEWWISVVLILLVVNLVNHESNFLFIFSHFARF